ncbi:Uncharacterised protein [Legionella beliardensis]|uniref:Uncharacterized protein n=1 Tax=Legionella beliardensis TaxID=91822 RepID=A0A378IAS8_9GAMM|nr:hypothetical protein [Legionella beliardensis]STX29424.1 Uncharacterised protein [Legionella beliardensis]
MDKKDKNKAHPEVEGLENICHITPNTDSTKEVCRTLKKEDKTKPTSTSDKKK